MDKGERLEKLILNSRHKNVMEFSKASQVPYTTIKSMIQRNLKNASVDNVIKICRVLGVSVEELTERKSSVTMIGSVSDYDYMSTVNISAGQPIEVDAITQVDKISIPDTLMGKHAGNENIYITRINGESMNNVMKDGSLIAVKPIEVSELCNGDIVVFSDGGEYGVKRFYQQGNEVLFRPDSTDFRFRDNIYSLDDADGLEIHGKVVLYIVEMD